MKNLGSSPLSRRQFLTVAGIGIAAASFAPRLLFGQSNAAIVPAMLDEAAKAKIETQPIRRSISVLSGSGGNIAVLSGKDGKLLIDSGFRVSKPRLTEALARVSSDPITQLINTHWHTDHTDGNEWVHAAGAHITAHENTKKHLAASTRVEGWKWTFPPASASAQPATVFDKDHRLHHNDTEIALRYYGPAHTDSDISVVFQDADVIHVGDTWWNGIFPFIDYSTGGSIDGMIHATEQNLNFISEKMIVIPGHGPVGNKAGLGEFQDMLVTIRRNVADLKNQGKSVEETVAAKPTQRYDAKFGQSLISPAFFTSLVYIGV
jgi:glyoxylase-like metal-dependent hydrolase (beta-lactamase superfamily II)